MQFYITKNNKNIIKKHYFYLFVKEVYFINIENIILKNNIKLENKYDYFILKSFIINEILLAYKRKRYKTIVYIVKNIDRELIYSLRLLLKDLKIFISIFGLIDFKQELDSKIYKFFDTVM